MPFESKLFSSVTVRGLTLRNRIVLSPLCMYSAKKGLASDFHASHLSAFARGIDRAGVSSGECQFHLR